MSGPLVHLFGSMVQIKQADATLLHVLAIIGLSLLLLAMVVGVASEGRHDKADTMSCVFLGFGGITAVILAIAVVGGVPW